MRTIQTWLARLLLPIWLGIYFIGFRTVWALVFVPIVIARGIWFATLIAFLVYVVWGTVFYFLILQGSVFDKVRDKLTHLAPKKENRLVAWLKERLSGKEDRILISPWWVFATFVVMGVLTGVLVIRVSYPRKYFGKALLLIVAGCVFEVLTWFLPIYGGGVVLVQKLLAFVFGS